MQLLASTLLACSRAAAVRAVPWRSSGTVRCAQPPTSPPLGQDLSELFALYEAPALVDAPMEGEPSPLGVSKPRGEVHRCALPPHPAPTRRPSRDECA